MARPDPTFTHRNAWRGTSNPTSLSLLVKPVGGTPSGAIRLPLPQRHARSWPRLLLGQIHGPLGAGRRCALALVLRAGGLGLSLRVGRAHQVTRCLLVLVRGEPRRNRQYERRLCRGPAVRHVRRESSVQIAVSRRVVADGGQRAPRDQLLHGGQRALAARVDHPVVVVLAALLLALPQAEERPVVEAHRGGHLPLRVRLGLRGEPLRPVERAGGQLVVVQHGRAALGGELLRARRARRLPVALRLARALLVVLPGRVRAELVRAAFLGRWLAMAPEAAVRLGLDRGRLYWRWHRRRRLETGHCFGES